MSDRERMPRGYTPSGAESHADAVWNLYMAMSKRFGSDKAWDYVLVFYKGAGIK